MIRVSNYSFILLLFLLWVPAHAMDTISTVEMLIKGKVYQLEIADTHTSRQQGLMHRTQLDDDQGMLFVYPSLGNHRIWMKNTLIPLTVLWLDEQARVTHKRLLFPCDQSPCPIYHSKQASRFILELNARAYPQFEVGDRLTGLLP